MVSFVLANLSFFLEFAHFLIVMRPALFGRLIQQSPNFHKKVSLLLFGVKNAVVENEGEVVMKVFEAGPLFYLTVFFYLFHTYNRL